MLHGPFAELCSVNVLSSSDIVTDGVHTFLPHLEESQFVMRVSRDVSSVALDSATDISHSY